MGEIIQDCYISILKVKTKSKQNQGAKIMVYSSSNRPTETTTESQVYHNGNGNGHGHADRVRWGPILSGLMVAISTQLLLSALGAALGFSNIAGSEAPRSNSGPVAQAVGVWSIISVFISLFIGGWVTARAAGSINRNTALLNGAILWATTLAISSWLLATGVSGAFGLAASKASDYAISQQAQQTQQNGGANIPGASSNAVPSPMPSVTAEQTRETAGNGAKASWGYTFASLLGLAAAVMGAGTGARNENRDYRSDV